MNYNAIIGGLLKLPGELLRSIPAALRGQQRERSSIKIINNFSGITVSGSTVIAGWFNADATGGSTKTIQNNTFSNWVAGTGAVTAISVSITSTGNATTGNLINNISGGGAITGIATAAGNDKIFSNTINTISSTGGAVTGIAINTGTTKDVYSNKIYDLQATNTSGTVNGILVAGTTNGVITANIYNNLIGDLRTPAASGADPVRGISITSTRLSSTINVYYNTVYLNAISTATNFGTTGIHHVANAVATTAALNLRNNIISNNSTPGVTGLIVAFRRNGVALNNYATSSNNNLLYAGTPATNRLIYYDNTNSYQTLASFKTLVATRDAQSVSEDLITLSKFLSTSGASASFLHLDPSKSSLAESGAVTIENFPNDFDGEPRNGNAGYSGTGTAPDIGADEFNGIPATSLSGTYNVGAGQTYTSLTNTGGLFAEINNLGLAGNIVVNITSDLTEDGSNALYEWVEEGEGNYTVTIQPDASVARTISGNVLAGLIRLNGAKRLIIDGSNGTVNNYLTFTNTSTAGTTGTAFTFINGASNNSIRYCTIEAYTNLSNGVILFSTSAVTGGNSNNVISNCTINATVSGNTGVLGIYSLGTSTAGFANAANTISNNQVINYRERGLDISPAGSTGWIISGNSFYNGDIAGNINYAAGTLLHTIRVSGGSGYTILNNFIGGNAGRAAGIQAAYYSTAGLLVYEGILLTTTSAIPISTIKGNTIANISVSVFSASTSTSSSNVFFAIETNGSGINIGGNLAGEGNTIGSNSVNGSISITTNTTGGLKTNIRGISSASAGGVINGNQVSGIDIKNIGSTPGASTFWAIYVNNAAAPAQVNNNIIGSNGTGAVSNSIRVPSTSTSISTSLTGIYIGAAVTSTIQVNGNIIRNISHQSATASGVLTGINTSAVTTAVVTINNNTIAGNATSATAGPFYGIFNNSANPASLTISNNTISANTSTATSGILYGIYIGSTVPAPASTTISNNTFSANTNTTSTGLFAAIVNASITPSLSITNNTINGNFTSSATGIFNAIVNTGVVSATVTINANNIGTVGSPAITFNAVNSGAQALITNNFVSPAPATAVLSVSNNVFNGMAHTIAATGTTTFILNSAATFSQTINGNLFTNLIVNTTGAVTFISNSVIVPATGTQSVNNNAISGTFIKTGTTGAVTLFNSSASSPAGSVINNNNNNFSNITVSGATTIAGWVNTDQGASTKTIQSNTFSRWTGGTGLIVALSVNILGTNNTSGNAINNITSNGSITGILTGAGNDNIFSNIINTLSSGGTASGTTVNGISVTAGTTKDIYRNKIYDLQATNATNILVNGILVAGSTTANIYNNLVGDLRTPAANTTTDVIRGISVTSAVANTTINLYFNTIYLNASSTGTNFSTSGIYHVTNATASTGALNMINNSITNISTSNGTGITVAYRISSATLANYATTSNNNLFYAGIPAANKQIFNASTVSDQTLAAFKTRMANREQLSVTENLSTKFLSTAGSSAVFLHMDDKQPTIIESGAVNITGFTKDFDDQTRAGNPGYSGADTSPDIGADEIFGIEVVPPTITYTLLTDTTASAVRHITDITITDASGVNTSAGNNPRIYFKRLGDANVWLDNAPTTNGWKYTEATNAVSPFTFTINYSILYGGSTATAGIIQYFIVAQDLATIANVGINSGSFNTTPGSVALTAAAFPIGGTINSYKIPFSGTFNVGMSEAFTSLTKDDGLFAAINSAGLNGNIIFNITSDLAEDGTNALNQWTESGVGNYTVTIKPNVASLRTISGDAVAGLIRLDGADRVTIDGSNGSGGIYFSFKNTNTAGTTGTAFTFINGATNNNIRYCNAEAYTNTANAVMLFSTSAIAGGNSNNQIDNCTINATIGSNTGNIGIYSLGTLGNENSSNTISNNIISDYKDRGLDISSTGSTAWIIAGNHFFNGDVAGDFDYAASTPLFGIRVLGGSGYSINNNYIGGSEALAGGTNAIYSSTLGNLYFQGILLSTTSALPVSAIKANRIAAITISSRPSAINSGSFAGITTTGSGIIIGGNTAAEGNIIGSATVNGSITVKTSTSSSTYNTSVFGINSTGSNGTILYNRVSGIDITNIGSAPAPSSFQGIFVNNAIAPTQVNNNLVGSRTTANSIRVLPASTATTTSLTGIAIGTAVNAAVEIKANRVENISNLSTTSSGSFTGINNAATLADAIITISNDTIQNIRTAINANVGSTAYSGIMSSSASTISNNLINTIILSSTGINAQIAGINVSGSNAITISGNLITNLSTSSNKATANVETGSPASSAIIGILNATSADRQVINNNRFAGFTATSAAAVNVVVTGIGITAGSSGNIFSNKFGTFTNVATGTAPALCHIMAAGGSFNVYNNVLRISNLTNTNAIKIYGILHSSGTSWNYFFNTVRVTGTPGGTPLRSAAFLLSGNSAPVLKNNIFFNIRSGSGINYAVSILNSPAINWLPTTSDYNDLYTTNPNTLGEWGVGINKSFDQWKTISGGDAHSINNSISFINSTYDLEPDSVTNCNFNNAGTPINSPIIINSDINSRTRNTLNPDLGAYEFNYVGFSIIAGSDSPVCAGDSLLLTVNPGNALIPHYSWRNPSNVVISTRRNPTVPLMAGLYKITVTDSTGCTVTDSTLVAINLRPTAKLTAKTSVCDSGLVNLVITVTGTGTITGSLSNGEDFSGTAPTITMPVYTSTTTEYSVVSLADVSCPSIPIDFPDTVTVMVTHKGDWLGNTSNWNDPLNWCEGVVPTSFTDVTIPSEAIVMPIITDSASCRNLIIETGDTLTIAATGTLKIAGLLTNAGIYIDNGTTLFNGGAGQQTFSGVTTFNNLILNNTGGLLVSAAIVVKNNLTILKGILHANNQSLSIAGNWTNNLSALAFTAGTATVTFNGTVSQTIGGTSSTTFYNLIIANTLNTVNLGINTSISGNLSVTSGIFNLGGFTANRVSAGGTLSVANNATLRIGSTNTFPVNYTTNTLVVASTVEYAGTNQTVANQTYGNLTLSSSGGAAIKTSPATPLTVVGNLTTSLGTGTSVSFTAASNVTVNGNVVIGVSTTFNGASFAHNIGGNWTNNGTFSGSTSTIIFNGSGKVVGGNGTQNFNNLTVAIAGISFASNSLTLTGNLATTGSGSFTQSPGGLLVMSGTGKTISGSGISLDNLTVSGSVSTATSMTLTGNLSVSGNFVASSGAIAMSGTSKTISGAGTASFYTLSSGGSLSTTISFSIASSLIVNGSLSASAGSVTFTGTSTLSGPANLFNVILNGTSLTLSTGSVLGISNLLTIISGNLNVTSSAPNTVNFNGTGSQNINAITYSNLILSNGNTKTAVGPITSGNDVTIGTGTIFNPSSFTLSIYGNWINNGTFVPGTGTVEFLGTSNALITGVTTFNILTSNATSSSTNLLLQSNISASIVNMIKGELFTGSNTLTITNTRTGSGIILGNIQRTHAFTTGVTYAFEGPDNTITFSAVSSVSSVTVSVTRGIITDFPFGGSISRLYTINVPAGTYNATLRLHYEDDELNGNNEASMALWHNNGSGWVRSGITGNSTSSNYVEQAGLTNINNRWTCSDNANLVQWNGSVSSDWNTAANWTVLQGSGTAPPSASDIVDLGSATFINQPTINTGVTVKNIVFGSAKAVTLTLGSGGSLTTLGDINGSWSGNATHTINVNDQNLTVNGSMNLSDGINGHAINLNINAGTVSTLASLVESGGASIFFSGAGTLNIFKDFTHDSGMFTAGTGKVAYNGTENQIVANINYYTLVINKASGLANINDTVNVAGNLIINSGELDNFSVVTVSGNISIDLGSTLKNHRVIHLHGNWDNKGTYISDAANVYFDGTGTQTISASTFNNLNINKPSGTAILTGEVTVSGNFNFTLGTFDFKTYNVTRDVIGGSAIIADGATALIGGNNGPVNFGIKTVGVNSTIIYDGTDLQYISSEGISFGNIIFRNGGNNSKLLVTPALVKGNLTIENGAILNPAGFTIALDGNWINDGIFVPATSTVIMNGASKTVKGNTTFNKVTINGSYTVLNDLTFNGLLNVTLTGEIRGGSTIHTTLHGDLINSGTLYTLGTTTYSGNVLQTLSLIDAVQTVALTVNFNGSVPPVLNSSTAPVYGYLNINNTGGISPSVGWTIMYSLTVGNGAAFNGGSSTHDITGNVTNNGTITSSGTLNFIPASAATVNLGSNFSSTGKVVFGGPSALTLAGTATSMHDVIIANTNPAGISPSSNWNITNDFTLNGDAIFNAGSYTYKIGGDIQSIGVLNRQNSTFHLNGSSAQDIFSSSPSPFNNIIVQNTAGAVTVSSDIAVYGVLNIISGNLQTGPNSIFISSTGSLTGASQNTGWINGNLTKNVAIGTNIIRTFEVGDSINYTPVSIILANVTASGDLSNRTTPADHPQVASSEFDVNKTINRYFTISNAGTAYTSASLTFNWVAGDVDPGSITTAFKVKKYNGSTWTSLLESSPLPTSITVTGVLAFGDFAFGQLAMAYWTGSLNSDWFTAGNWSAGVPFELTNANIPGSLTNYPIVNTGTGKVQNITIQPGATLTISGAVFQVSGIINNSGTFTASNGTIEMNGAGAQAIPAHAFTGNTIKNLTVTNSAGVTLEDSLLLTGVLLVRNGQFKTGAHLTLVSSATQSALIDGSGTGEVVGNVTMQRYLTSGFGYKYLSSPFQAARVNELADDLDLAAAFPSLYRYDENQLSSGWQKYTDPSLLLYPGEGYTANFGSGAAPKTFSITGAVNNHSITSATLYNHNRPYTLGFNLVGNPYPSPVDWDASAGWSRTNIDEAVYYFDNGDSSQYTGTYSTYINGISSNGVANNIIAAMQGFFVHVSNGAYPVAGTITVNNNARVNNLAPNFHRHMSLNVPLLRIRAGFEGEKTPSDPVVIYFEDGATKNFEPGMDAIKLMNTDTRVPNLYTVASDGSRLSIGAWPSLRDSIETIPLGLQLKQAGWISFNASDITLIPGARYVYLYDTKLNTYQDLRLHPLYRLYLETGNYENRFFIICKLGEAHVAADDNKIFTAFNTGGTLYVNCTLADGEKANLVVSNMIGQVVFKQELTGGGTHAINTKFVSGLYVVSLSSGKKIRAKKVFIGY